MANNIFNRANGDENKAKKILVAVKGAEIDDEAIRLAFTYAAAKKHKGRIVTIDVVYVVQVPHALPLDAELTEQVEKGEKALDHAEAVARDMGLDVDASILQARSAGAAIVDMARESGTELIVMAT
ncbi:MAG TPA: universal stress protein, partial [Ktedonobacteraceae bacterium]|nr:universal stress protein [Ktedonobacteraceae bacterium]